MAFTYFTTLSYLHKHPRTKPTAVKQVAQPPPSATNLEDDLNVTNFISEMLTLWSMPDGTFEVRFPGERVGGFLDMESACAYRNCWFNRTLAAIARDREHPELRTVETGKRVDCK